jgi:hypothetical protein
MYVEFKPLPVGLPKKKKIVDIKQETLNQLHNVHSQKKNTVTRNKYYILIRLLHDTFYFD